MRKKREWKDAFQKRKEKTKEILSTKEIDDIPIDEEIVPYLKAINDNPSVNTLGSCSGHTRNPWLNIEFKDKYTAQAYIRKLAQNNFIRKSASIDKRHNEHINFISIAIYNASRGTCENFWTNVTKVLSDGKIIKIRFPWADDGLLHNKGFEEAIKNKESEKDQRTRHLLINLIKDNFKQVKNPYPSLKPKKSGEFWVFYDGEYDGGKYFTVLYKMKIIKVGGKARAVTFPKRWIVRKTKSDRYLVKKDIFENLRSKVERMVKKLNSRKLAKRRIIKSIGKNSYSIKIISK